MKDITAWRGNGITITRRWSWSSSIRTGKNLLRSQMGQFLCPILHLPLQGMCELPFVSSMDPHLIATTAHMRSRSKKSYFLSLFLNFFQSVRQSLLMLCSRGIDPLASLTEEGGQQGQLAASDVKLCRRLCGVGTLPSRGAAP